MIAPSSEIWGKCLYLMYRPSGGSGEVSVTRPSRSGSVRANHLYHSPKEREKQYIPFSMIACFRLETEFQFECTTGNNLW